jgi:hypothetical protein
MAAAIVIAENDPVRGPDDAARWGLAGTEGWNGIDEALAWARARSDRVVVRTLAGLVFSAGSVAEGAPDARPWPPSTAERVRIRRAYAEAAAALDRSRATDERYGRRRALFIARTGTADGEQTHHWLLRDPGGDEISIESIDASRDAWGAHRQTGPDVHFGPLVQVLARASGRAPEDGWLQAVARALRRELRWRGRNRRRVLVVTRREGVLFHAAAAANRNQIRAHGLDPRHVRAAPFIRSERLPITAGIVLTADAWSARWFAVLPPDATDVWAVRVDGLWLEGDPGLWVDHDGPVLVTAALVTPERLELVEQDVPPLRAADVKELIRRALPLTEDDEDYWTLLHELRRRRERTVLEAALRLCGAGGTYERALGARMLEELVDDDERPFAAEVSPAAVALCTNERDPHVLGAATSLLGALKDPRGLEPLLGLMDHDDPGLRLHVAMTLPHLLDETRPAERGVRALMVLMEDGDEVVRDWATAALGSMLDVDTPAVRDALARRLDDPDPVVFGEALVGLARRGDERARARVEAALRDLAAGIEGPDEELTRDAAEALGLDPTATAA